MNATDIFFDNHSITSNLDAVKNALIKDHLDFRTHLKALGLYDPEAEKAALTDITAAPTTHQIYRQAS